MLLVTLTIGAATRRVSNEEISTLTNPWHAEIVSAPSITKAIEKDYGGMVKMRWGDISFLPTTFEETTWPPPKSIEIVVEWTATTEGAAVSLFTGSLHRKQITRQAVVYSMYAEEHDLSVEDEAFTGTLTSEFSGAASDLSLSYNDDDARGTSPDTDYTATGQLVALLSPLAAYHTHFCWIDGTTLYLADMLSNIGEQTLTEFDFEPVVYTDLPPYSRIEDADYGVDGSYPYGGTLTISPACETSSESDAETALTNIKTIVEMPRVKLSCPITATTVAFAIGEKVTFTNSIQDLSGWLRIRSIQYDFNKRFITFSGDGYIE